MKEGEKIGKYHFASPVIPYSQFWLFCSIFVFIGASQEERQYAKIQDHFIDWLQQIVHIMFKYLCYHLPIAATVWPETLFFNIVFYGIV